MSALSILLTAPLGAALMDILGHRLLKKEEPSQERPACDSNERPPKSSISAIQISAQYGSCSPTAPVLPTHYGSCSQTQPGG